MSPSNTRPQPRRGRWARAAWLALGGATLLVLAGCQNADEGIRHYQVPRTAAVPPPAGPARAPQRLLGAVVPQGENTWFFKLLGPDQAVGTHEGEFRTFVRSVRFTGQADRPVAWTAPAGWQEEPGKDLRYATLRLGAPGQPLELTVIKLGRLGGAAGSLLDNLNRWRGQVGLPPVAEADLGKMTTELKLEGEATATLVDLHGLPGKAAGGPPFAGRMPPPGRPAAPPAQGPIRYKTPDGWRVQAAGPGSMRAAAFTVSEGGKSAEVTVIPLGAQAGSVLDNVNRWRGQLGLAPIGAADLRRDLREVRIDGQPASYVELVSPDQKGMLVAMLSHQGRTWFFKMTGPAELVERQKPAFKAFLESVRFGGTGANHE